MISAKKHFLMRDCFTCRKTSARKEAMSNSPTPLWKKSVGIMAASPCCEKKREANLSALHAPTAPGHYGIPRLDKHAEHSCFFGVWPIYKYF